MSPTFHSSSAKPNLKTPGLLFSNFTKAISKCAACGCSSWLLPSSSLVKVKCLQFHQNELPSREATLVQNYHQLPPTDSLAYQCSRHKSYNDCVAKNQCSGQALDASGEVPLTEVVIFGKKATFRFSHYWGIWKSTWILKVQFKVAIARFRLAHAESSSWISRGEVKSGGWEVCSPSWISHLGYGHNT